MSAVEVTGLSYSYGRVQALRDVDLAVPEGALYALLGPNGSGKTTLLQILMGLRRPSAGRAAVLGADVRALGIEQRRRVAYVAEGQPLPGWMTLAQVEAYLAPLYPAWDRALASSLRERFALDPRRKVGTLSRGEHMKAALLCALAPRPRLLIMDEPFTGMDALVKDELVRGLLAASGGEGRTVVVCSHDIGELEMLADWVGFLAGGRMRLAGPMEQVKGRFKRVTVVGDEAALARRPGDAWLSEERAGRRLSFVTDAASETLERVALPQRFAGAERLEVQDASLREIFVALAREERNPRSSPTRPAEGREVAA